MKFFRGDPETVRLTEPVMSRDDFVWLVIQLELLQRAALDRQPGVELVMHHPGIPPGRVALIHGVRAEHGELGLTLRKKD